MTAELNARGHDVLGEHGGRTHAGVHGIRAKAPRRFVRTTDSNHRLPVAENVLDRDFEPEGPNESWCADITYIPTREGWLYLAVVEDLFSRMIVGWSMDETMESRLVVDALEMAIGTSSSGRRACWRTRIAGASTPASTTSGCCRRKGSCAA